MISIHVVRLALKINVFKMNKHSKWAIEKATNFPMFLPQIGRVRRHLLHITSMNGIFTRKFVNASFKEVLNFDENFQRFSGRMFYVWDGNHQL
jgi:hypothetical protein